MNDDEEDFEEQLNAALELLEEYWMACPCQQPAMCDMCKRAKNLLGK